MFSVESVFKLRLRLVLILALDGNGKARIVSKQGQRWVASS